MKSSLNWFSKNVGAVANEEHHGSENGSDSNLEFKVTEDLSVPFSVEHHSTRFIYVIDQSHRRFVATMVDSSIKGCRLMVQTKSLALGNEIYLEFNQNAFIGSHSRYTCGKVFRNETVEVDGKNYCLVDLQFLNPLNSDDVQDSVV